MNPKKAKFYKAIIEGSFTMPGVTLEKAKKELLKAWPKAKIMKIKDKLRVILK